MAAHITKKGDKKTLLELQKGLFCYDNINGAEKNEKNILEKTIDWSWYNLEPWEKSVLMQCSLFCGGFFIEAAENVLSLDEFTRCALGFRRDFRITQ